MSNVEIAIFISAFSLAISIAGFIWSIFKEFIYVKPKLRVSFALYSLVDEEAGPIGSVLGLFVTNMGPGPAIIHSCVVGFWNGWFKRLGLGMINPLVHPMNRETHGPFTGLPRELQPGHNHTFHFICSAEECFFKRAEDDLGRIYRVGVHDTYGRIHWASRRSVREAIKRYEEAFPDALEPNRQSPEAQASGPKQAS